MSVNNDTKLEEAVKTDLTAYFKHMAAKVDKTARLLPADEFWKKPFAFGNSVGHLVLHLTGNLQHYIGAGIAGTDYKRDREREFTEGNPPEPAEALRRFHEAVGLVERTIQSLDSETLCAPKSDQKPVSTQFGLLLVCAAHLNNHIGQMSYLVHALGRESGDPPSW